MGGGLKDIDIIGLAPDGRKIFAQVTYLRRNSKTVDDKARRLQPYGDGGDYLLMFCRDTQETHKDGIRYVPVEKVLEWVSREPAAYREALFG